MENYNFLQNTCENFLLAAKKRKVVLFGASIQMKDALNKIIKPQGILVEYVVDNDYKKWYMKLSGLEIKEPEALLTEKENDIVVLITSRYPYRIEKQLLRMGIKCYFSYMLFLDRYIGKHQFMVFF